jgi:hypothetical protein
MIKFKKQKGLIDPIVSLIIGWIGIGILLSLSTLLGGASIKLLYDTCY